MDGVNWLMKLHQRKGVGTEEKKKGFFLMLNFIGSYTARRLSVRLLLVLFWDIYNSNSITIATIIVVWGMHGVYA